MSEPHDHDWLPRQQGASRYCPRCDTTETLDAARQPTVDVPRVFRCDFDCDACRATADHYGIALAAQETPE